MLGNIKKGLASLQTPNIKTQNHNEQKSLLPYDSTSAPACNDCGNDTEDFQNNIFPLHNIILFRAGVLTPADFFVDLTYEVGIYLDAVLDK